jgi:AcrR family transcriptional regulator
MAEPPPGVPRSRRERYREETREEAKSIALAQLAESGVAGVSVNAIAKRMGITGPALYRYFGSRDDLLTALIGDAYHDLADAMEASVRDSAAQRPADRFRSLAMAFRGWAVRQPHRYQLLFGTPVPGYHAPEEMIAAAHRAMAALWEVLSALPEPLPSGSGELDAQLVAWGEDRWGETFPPGRLRRAVLTWTRWHGMISTELAGHLRPMGIDPELLFRAEIDGTLAAEAGNRGETQ